MDPRNVLSLAGILGALQDATGMEFCAGLFLNTDVTSILLEHLPEAARLAAASTIKLHAQRKGACVTIDVTHQDRTVSVMATIAADGARVCTVVYIKDSNVTALERIIVSDG